MLTIERAIHVKKNMDMKGEHPPYSIYWDKKYGCFRVVSKESIDCYRWERRDELTICIS